MVSLFEGLITYMGAGIYWMKYPWTHLTCFSFHHTIVHRDASSKNSLSLSALRSQRLLFEGPAAISRGMQTTTYRKFQIVLSKCIPYGKYLYDEKDYVSYGELLRYIAVIDGTLLVYTEETATHPLYSVPIDSLNAVKERREKSHPKSVIVSPMANTNMQPIDLQTVLLVDARNDLILQCTFDCKRNFEIVDRFVRAIRQSHTTSSNFIGSMTLSDKKHKKDGVVKGS